MSLRDNVVIITGGSGGIGRAMLEAFAAKGAAVLFTYHHGKNAVEYGEELGRKYKTLVKAYKVDVGDYNQVLDFSQKAAEWHNKIDVVINNAGIRKDKTLLYMKKEEWDKVLETNLSGAFHMTQSVMPFMLKQRRGRIINISSISGINGLAGQANYSSSKAGIIGFTKAIAKEVAPFGMSVNALAPGPVETDMLQGLSTEQKDRLLAGVPIKRMCTPSEVAMMAKVLADDELTPWYLTGQVISLDGGMGL